MKQMMSYPSEVSEEISHSLLAICGSRYNAFEPARNRGEEACRFFRPNTTRRVELLQEPMPMEAIERWDGMA